MKEWIIIIIILSIFVGISIYIYLTLVYSNISPRSVDKDAIINEANVFINNTEEQDSRIITKMILFLSGEYGYRFKLDEQYAHVERLIETKKSILIENNIMKSLYMFESDTEYFLTFAGTKRVHAFIKEFFTRNITTCDINGIRLLNKFSQIYSKYYYGVLRNMVHAMNKEKNVHVLGYSLGGVISHLFVNDFCKELRFKSLDTVGIPCVFSKLNHFNHMQQPQRADGDIENGSAYCGCSVNNYVIAADIVANFYEPIIENEPMQLPGRIITINENHGSYLLNHEILYYFVGILKLYQKKT